MQMTLATLRAELAKLRQREAARDSIAARLDPMRAELAEEKLALEELRKELDEAKAEQSSLDAWSFGAFFRSLLGDDQRERAAKLRNEISELQEQFGKHFDACRQRDAECARLEGEFERLRDVDDARRRLFAEKAEAIREAGGAQAAELDTCVEQVRTVRQLVKDGELALTYIDSAQKHLRACYNSIENAAVWSGIDIMGGGVGTTLIKQQRIGSARSSAQLAEGALRRASSHLKAFGLAAPKHIAIPDCHLFADTFLDALFDIVVHIKLRGAREQVTKAEAKTRALRGDLRAALRKARSARDEAEAAYRDFLYTS